MIAVWRFSERDVIVVTDGNKTECRFSGSELVGCLRIRRKVEHRFRARSVQWYVAAGQCLSLGNEAGGIFTHLKGNNLYAAPHGEADFLPCQ